MSELLVDLWRVAIAAIGALSLYVAFFLYEDEEGRLQNRLEELWLRIASRDRSSPSAPSRLLWEVVILASAALDRYFGKRLISIQALGVSYFLSVGSALSYVSVVLGSSGIFALAAIVCIILASLPAIFPKPWAVHATFWLGLMSAIYWARLAVKLIATFDIDHVSQGTEGLGQVLLLGVGVLIFLYVVVAPAVGYAWILATRGVLCWSARSPGFSRLATLLVFNLFGFALYHPASLDWAVTALNVKPESALAPYIALLVVASWLTPAIVGLFILLTLTVQAGLGLAVVLHWGGWNIADRLIYAIARHKLLRNRKILGAFGFSLLGAAGLLPKISDWLTSLL